MHAQRHKLPKADVRMLCLMKGHQPGGSFPDFNPQLVALIFSNPCLYKPKSDMSIFESSTGCCN